ncbi:hypothetical protein JTB14_022756 [Gonioctena quinquepunctata]|nr:hypothetical protein JTB14_022756 [Gonioctena quinquepunctata]
MIEYILFLFLFLFIVSRLTSGWCYSKECLLGKTALITGANSGIGYEAALTLASRGCKVIIADVVDATAAKNKIIRETNNPNVVTKHLDLGSLDSVRRLAEEIITTEKKLDLLINNAGQSLAASYRSIQCPSSPSQKYGSIEVQIRQFENKTRKVVAAQRTYIKGTGGGPPVTDKFDPVIENVLKNTTETGHTNYVEKQIPDLPILIIHDTNKESEPSESHTAEEIVSHCTQDNGENSTTNLDLGNEARDQHLLKVNILTNEEKVLITSRYLATGSILQAVGDFTDLLKESTPSRIIFTSSIAAFISLLDVENINPPETYPLSGFTYVNSKLCLAVAAKCFGEKLQGTGVTAYSFHPGAVRTRILWKALQNNALPWQVFAALFGFIALTLGKSPEEGAQTMLHLATDKGVEKHTGGHFWDCSRFFFPPRAYNAKFCENVWKKSKELVKLKLNECVI